MVEDSALSLINEEHQQNEQTQASTLKYQKFLYDSFVELRIKLQKVMLPLNRMPQGDAYDMFCENNNDIKDKSQLVVTSMKGFVCDLLSMNNEFMGKNPDITEHSKEYKNHKSINVTDQSSTEDIWKEVATTLSIKRRWQDETANYWTKRSQALNGTLTSKSLNALNKDLPSQINSIIEDEQRWRKRYSVVRGNYNILGKSDLIADDDGLIRDNNIYDDSDFYSTLLSYHTNKQGSESKTLSLKKAKINKKEVNRKASKGRRLRYQVHPKLMNFCAPESYPPTTMDVEQLFSSLFGKTGNSSN